MLNGVISISTVVEDGTFDQVLPEYTLGMGTGSVKNVT